MRRDRFNFVDKPPKPPGHGAWALQILLAALALLSYSLYRHYFPAPPDT